jgi:putative membrane-bound dehydrogenase-like protein
MRCTGTFLALLLGTALAAAEVGDGFKPDFDPRRVSGPGPQSPQQSLAAIRTHKDLLVELVAAEPLLASPVAIDFGPDGRLWVAEMIDYPAGNKGDYKPGGRIVVLEATHGDRKYDKATVFLDNIPFPTGLTVWRKGLLVCTAPDILYAEDTDGDGKADVVRKLFNGFGDKNYQARVNSLEYGLDNWVYGSCGLFGGQIHSFAGGTINLGDRDFRVHPDTGVLEPATGRTQQGRVRDDWGNWFGCDNTNLLWHYPLADHYLCRNPHVIPPIAAVTVPDYPQSNKLYPITKLQLFKLSGPPGQTTAACGLGIYRDEVLGREYRGNAFICEPVNLLIHRLQLTPHGSTFSGRRAADETTSEFLASTDNWFRPVQARTGPDGALWVVDMYRYVIEHPRWIPPEDLARLDVRAGHDLGRIYRVRRRDGELHPWPRLDKLDIAGLVAALDTANGWQRDMSGQMLLWKGDPSAAPALQRLARKAARAEARLHALCVLDGLGKLSAEVVRQALADPHPGVRRHAVRLSERFLAAAPELGAGLVKLVDDGDGQVRLQLAYSLGEWRDPKAGRMLATLAQRHADDPYLTAAVLSSIRTDNIGEVLAGVLTDNPDKAPPDSLVRQLLDLAAALGKGDVPPAVLRQVTTPRQGQYARWQLAAVAGMLDALERRGQSLEQLAHGQAAEAIRRMLAAARATAVNDKTPTVDRAAAVQVLGREVDKRAADIALLGQLLVPQNDPTLQAAAVTALGRISDDHVPQVLTAGWAGLTPALRPEVLDLLLSRDAWQRQLLRAIEKNEVSAGHIDAARRQRLLEHKDTAIRTRAAKVFAGAVRPDRQKVVREYQDVLTLAGDRGRGKTVFAKTCAACHRLQDVGHAVGPDLAGLTTKSPQYLLTAILDPSMEVDSRYVEYMAATKTGRLFMGILASETATSITLRGQEGKDYALLRSDLDELRSTGKSLMPEGLERDLTRQDLADLIAFVTATAQPPK